MTHAFKWMTCPVGPLKLVASSAGLAAIMWEKDGPDRVRLGALSEAPDNPVLSQTERQLLEYFEGKRRAFALPLAFNGTPFQTMVWRALLTIPYGETRTYAQVARQIGRPTAMRAVGAANGRNPISIVAPCHRVIGSSGALTGFAGGLEIKRRLLDMEAARSTLSASFA